MAKPKPSQKTALCYCRTSTKKQRDEKTIDAQITSCKRLAERHELHLASYGAKKDGWLIDDGISGTLLAGRCLGKLVDDLRAGRVRVDYLVTYSMSRIARQDKSSADPVKLEQSAVDLARIKSVLAGAGVQIIDEDGVHDPLGIMTDIKGAFASQERTDMLRRTKSGKARRLGNNAIATGGRCPWGYQRVPIDGNRKNGTTYNVHPEDGERFKRVMGQWYVEGGCSYAARMAMKQGWLSPRGSKTWYPSTIQQLLNNLRAYLGETTRSIDGQTYAVTYEPLLDAKTYATITRRTKERTLKKRTTLLSTGYADCTCGNHIHGHRSRTTGKMYVRCRSKCGTMHEDKFSGALWELVVARLVQIKEHEQITNNGKDPYKAQLEAARGKLAKIQEQLDRLVALYTEGTIDTEALARQNGKLRESKALLMAEIERLEHERDAHATRKANEETAQTRVQAVLRKLRDGRVPLDGKRQVLADLLQGGRVIVEWSKASVKGRSNEWVKLTLPAFGNLSPVTIRTDRDITTQMHGVSRQVLDSYFEVEEVEDVAIG